MGELGSGAGVLSRGGRALGVQCISQFLTSRPKGTLKTDHVADHSGLVISESVLFASCDDSTAS